MLVYIGPYPDGDKERDIVVQIDNYDTWSIDTTLAQIIVPLLTKFKENLQGHPGDLTFEKWNIILDKMIWSFGQILIDWEEPYFTHYGDLKTEGNKIVDTGVTCDNEGRESHWKRIQEGFDLFGKYYASLWD